MTVLSVVYGPCLWYEGLSLIFKKIPTLQSLLHRPHLHSTGKSQSQLQCISWERLSSHVQDKLSHLQAAGAIIKT